MRKLILTVSLFSFFSLNLSFAQNMSDDLFEEYLEEKVRDSRIRAYVMDLKEQKELLEQGAITSIDDLPTVEDFMRTLPEYNQPNDNRIEYTFNGGAEPHVAIHPGNSLHLATSYMASGSTFDYPIFYSQDGGNTWTQSAFSTAVELDNQFPGESILGGGDPVLAFDDNGTLHMTWIYLHGSGFNVNAGMFYAYSTDGGINWTVPSNQSDHVMHDEGLFSQDMLDRQWLAVDNSGGPYDGNLYMSAIYFGGSLGAGGEVILTKYADSTGFTMTPTVAVPLSGSDAAQFGNVKVDDNGIVHLGCMKFDGNNGAGDYLHTMSTDGGATFTTPTVVGSGTTALPNGGNHPIHSRDNSACSMAVDGNNVYIAWCDFANSDVRSYYVYSNDGGATFSAPIQYGYDIFGAGYYHLMPNLAADDGNLSISWYKVDSVTFDTEYMMAVSTTAGASITGYGGLSGGNTDFANENSQDFYGDYNSSVMAGCIAHAIWGDGRTGAPIVYHGMLNACTVGMTEHTPVTDKIKVKDIYPNPVAQANISWPITLKEGGEMSIEIYDAAGKQLINKGYTHYSKGNHTLNMDVNDLAAGSYIVKLTLSNGMYVTRSFVKR